MTDERYPHKCPACGAPAYIPAFGAALCTAKGCHFFDSASVEKPAPKTTRPIKDPDEGIAKPFTRGVDRTRYPTHMGSMPDVSTMAYMFERHLHMLGTVHVTREESRDALAVTFSTRPRRLGEDVAYVQLYIDAYTLMTLRGLKDLERLVEHMAHDMVHKVVAGSPENHARYQAEKPRALSGAVDDIWKKSLLGS